MTSRVRAIHRALTGTEIPPAAPRPEGEVQAPDEEITKRFFELEQMVRSLPELAERVPALWFVPPLDVLAGDDAVILELAVPGMDLEEIVVTCHGSTLVVSGVRPEPGVPGRIFHAELPRGPFRRVIPVPFPVDAKPRVELDRGVLRIHLVAQEATRMSNQAVDQHQGEQGQ